MSTLDEEGHPLRQSVSVPNYEWRAQGPGPRAWSTLRWQKRKCTQRADQRQVGSILKRTDKREMAREVNLALFSKTRVVFWPVNKTLTFSSFAYYPQIRKHQTVGGEISVIVPLGDKPTIYCGCDCISTLSHSSGSF